MKHPEVIYWQCRYWPICLCIGPVVVLGDELRFLCCPYLQEVNPSYYSIPHKYCFILNKFALIYEQFYFWVSGRLVWRSSQMAQVRDHTSMHEWTMVEDVSLLLTEAGSFNIFNILGLSRRTIWYLFVYLMPVKRCPFIQNCLYLICSRNL